MNYLLDACALFALIAGESGEEVVSDLLEKAEKSEISLYMSKINLLEVYYAQIRDLSIERADEMIESVKASAIQVISDMSDDVFREAGRLKAKYKISFADAMALGYASVMDCHLVTADHHELDVVETAEHIKFSWIR